jgi:ATP-dependent RNA helicase DeaD
MKTEDQTMAGEFTPTATRGGNLVVCRPPAAAYAAPVFDAIAHKAGHQGLQLLVLAGDAMITPLARSAAGPWHAGGGTLLALPDAGRADTLTRDTMPTALVTTAEIATGLLARSALPLDDTTTILMAWPETWDDEAPLVDLMQDVPVKAQRILYSADQKHIDGLGERYLRKALVVGRQSTDPSPLETEIEVAVSSPDRVGQTVLEVLTGTGESGQQAASVWVATQAAEAPVRAALLAAPIAVELSVGQVPEAALVVAADLPAPDVLARLAQKADRLIVVTPPNGLPYLSRLVKTLSPARGLPQTPSETTLARQRATIERTLADDRGDLDRAVHALAPLLERHDPLQVAGALYRLWTATPAPTPQVVAPARDTRVPSAPAAGRGTSGTVRIFVTAGRKDQAGPADFVAALTRDLGVKPEDIGRIDVQETFSLIELPAASAAGIAKRLDGTSVRRRKVNARLERPRR